MATNREYEATVEVTVLLKAPNEDTAGERAEELAEALRDGMSRARKRWLDVESAEVQVRDVTDTEG